MPWTEGAVLHMCHLWTGKGWEEFRKEHAKNFQVCDGRVKICGRLELDLELKMFKKNVIFNNGYPV